VAIEPVITMISGGVFERHKTLKIVTIETNVGWVPWVLNSLDHAYKAHHMWARPNLPRRPSEYFAEHCFTTLLEDSAMLDVVVGMGFEDNILWSNDYPHHEGSFPHSRFNIQRQMGNLTEIQRAKILGENARRVFNIK
jgi:predicted TIM-barrel fold metal-dependent hydrolase